MSTFSNPQAPAAVLWDMDGTLIDTEPLWIRAETGMLGRYGIEMNDELRAALIGSGLHAGARLFQSLGVPLSIDEILDEWVESVVGGINAGEAEWRPGAVELLESLRDAGIPSIMVTAAARANATAVVSKLPDGLFSGIISGNDVDNEKPHPEPYLRGAELAGVAIEHCVALEDSPNGLKSAYASGAVAVGVPNIVALDAGPAHAVWKTLAGVDAAELSARFAALRATHPAATQTLNEEEPKEDLMTEAAPALSGPFRFGDRVQLTGPKGRLNTFTLIPEGEFHSHRGVIRHEDIVGLPDSSVIANSNEEEYLALRPLLSDFVMSMPRGAAIVYPKDAAQIVSLADIFPGARVVEAGVGSGALSLHLLRALGPTGELFSFERREEFAEIARANAESFHGSAPENWTVTVGDLQETLPAAVADGTVDRVVLDMLAPWECVDVAAAALKPGGVLICYVATATQLSRTAEGIRRAGLFTHPQSSETMVRGWHVEGLAVRPDHRMVGHTGFLITARRLAPGAVLPDLKRRASKSDFSDEDLGEWLPDLVSVDAGDVWTPEAMGERPKSDKILRKKVREARLQAEQRAAADSDSANSSTEDSGSAASVPADEIR